VPSLDITPLLTLFVPYLLQPGHPRRNDKVRKRDSVSHHVRAIRLSLLQPRVHLSKPVLHLRPLHLPRLAFRQHILQFPATEVFRLPGPPEVVLAPRIQNFVGCRQGELPERGQAAEMRVREGVLQGPRARREELGCVRVCRVDTRRFLRSQQQRSWSTGRT